MRKAVFLGLALLAACGGDGNTGETAPIAVLAAFPAELAAVLAQTDVTETRTVDGRIVRRGTIGGQPVVVVITGIGLINAERTTRAVLDAFDVRGVVMSGVAGSPLRIADVAVAERWHLPDGSSYPVHGPWLRRARRLAAAALPFARCAAVPNVTPEPVCMPHAPGLYVGGSGESDDAFTGAFPCRPGAGDVFGCDVADAAVAIAALPAELSPVQDMESAAVAAVAAARGVPFIAFRGVSDGNGDPLDLPGFPQQFFAYYRIAAHNAAVAAAAFVAGR